MKRIWIAIVALMPAFAFCQQIQSTDVDLRQDNKEFTFQAAEQTTPTLRAYIRENGSSYTSISNFGGIFYFASNSTSSIGMAITNTSSGRDYLEWALTKDQTVEPGTYFAQIIVTNTAGLIQEWVRGEFEITDSPGTTAANSWAWSSSNYATVIWVEQKLLEQAGTNAILAQRIDALISNTVDQATFLATNTAVNARIDVVQTGKVDQATFNASNATVNARVDVISTGKVSNATFEGSNTAVNARIDALATGKVDVDDWQGTNADLRAEILAAQDMATMGGDVTGASTNATVMKIRNVPIDTLAPDESKDGYGLKYSHSSGKMVLGPVASSGSSISNLCVVSNTAVSTDVTVDKVGFYRILRPGDLPSMVINVGGYEAAYFDLLGLTLQAGGIHLLSDFMAVNVAAYDGSVTAPAYTWDEDRDLGKYRISYGGDYGEGYCVSSNLIWFWAADGIHLSSGKSIFGLSYDAQIGSNVVQLASLQSQVASNDTDISSAMLQISSNDVDIADLKDKTNGYYLASNPSGYLQSNSYAPNLVARNSTIVANTNVLIVTNASFALFVGSYSGPDVLSRYYKDNSNGLYISAAVASYYQVNTGTNATYGTNQTMYARAYSGGLTGVYDYTGQSATVVYGETSIPAVTISSMLATNGSGSGLTNIRYTSITGVTTKSVTNSWIAGNSVTNRQIFIGGLLSSWTTNGVEL